MTQAFYYDIVCPYAYMAFSFLDGFGVFKDRVILKPILLGGLFKLMEREADPNQSLSQQRAEYLRLDIKRQAEYFGVKLNFHPRHPISTLSAMRFLHACAEEDRLELTRRLYQAYWQDNLAIDNESVLRSLTADLGIKVDLISSKSILREATQHAFNNKVFGVPTIAISNKLYFGADRLPLIEKELDIKLPDVKWDIAEPFDFYFDFSSPYSYLAWAEIKKALALGVKVNLWPVLLGAIFKEVGTVNIPMLSAHPHKTAYFYQDMQDWAQYRQTPFYFNTHFPLRTVTPLRIALLEKEAIDAMFAAAWAHNEDIGDKTVLVQSLNRAGFDGERLLERCEDDHIKDQLKSNTMQAIKRGVFGVPTFFVRGQQVFGQDRFLWIKKELVRR